MKQIIASILFAFIALTLQAQTDTTTISSSDYRWHNTDTKSWVFDLSGTITDADTLFVDGDTILSVYDTVIIDFPNKFGTAFAGLLVFSTSVVDTLDGATGNYRLFQSACDTCEYAPIIASTAITTPAQFIKTFDLHGIRLRLVIWTTGDTADFDGYLVLKPSSLSSD